MAARPYMTSTDLINSVKRKISFPTSQNTFSDSDILAFANEEMFIAQVPAIMEFHEEYFVFVDPVAVVSGVSRYAIPTRAIGMKLRDLKYRDTNGNIFDMSRINPEDKSFYQGNISTSDSISKYYVEGNYIVLLPTMNVTSGLTLMFYYFLRPNQLVANERAATITNFANQITTLAANIFVGDTVTINDIVFTAVASSPGANEFMVDSLDIQTATNLSAAINTNGVAVATNGTPSSATITLLFGDIATSQTVLTSNPSGFVIPTTTQLIQFNQLPATYQDPITFVTDSLYVGGANVDFLQTNPGHRTYAIDVQIPTNGVSGNIISFNLDDVPTNILVGDYICISNECIIPQIPPDLHNSLAQRTATMILAALGDQAGLQASMAKVQEMEKKQITLLDARVEGSPLKIAPKKSILRFQGMGSRRRRL